MPTFYNYTENGAVYSFDDVFVPADAFRQGNLWAWGYNTSGQLGDNTLTNKRTPVTTFAGGTNWKQGSCGSLHSAAVKTDGTLWTWGQNANAKIGINDVTSVLISIPVTTFAGGTNWKQVSCGGQHSAAIKTDGTLWTWGYNYYGSLGDNTNTTKSTPVTTFLGGTNWKQVSCGIDNHTAAIKTDGTLWAWGYNYHGPTGNNTNTNRSTPVTTFLGGTNWKQVECGLRYTAAIKTDGTLWTWGQNTNGKLGINDTTTRRTPVTTFAGGTNWKQVSCGYNHTAAVKTDGTLWTWGTNYYSETGDNTQTDRSTPVTTFAGGTNWIKVSAGGQMTAAIKTDGTLWTWGAANNGQLGNNFFFPRRTPITTFAGGTNWKQVDCGGQHSVGFIYIDDYI